MCEIETARVFSTIGATASVALHNGRVIAFVDGLAMPYEAFVYSLVKAMSYNSPEVSAAFLADLSDLWADVGMPDKYRANINKGSLMTMLEAAAQAVINECKDETPAMQKANVAAIVTRLEFERERLISQP